MTKPIVLNARQTEMLDEGKKAYFGILSYIEGKQSDDIRLLHRMMAEAAHKLHMDLKRKGMEPRFGKHMLANRGVPPTDVEFYNHVHAFEDLMKYLDDLDANNDPEDLTLGQEFEVRIYSRRWGHDDFYQIKRTETGWIITQMVRGGPSDKRGAPGFYHALDGDSINYPEELPGYMEWLWERAAEDGLTKEQLAEGLNDLAEWISICEKSSPKGVFQGYK